MPARAWVIDSTGVRHFTPDAPASCTPYPRDESFSCDGWFEMALPSGRFTIHVERGKEYIPVNQEGELAPGGSAKIDLALTRWVNMPERGYYSADVHVHFGHDQIEVLKQLSLADDVNLVPALTSWLSGREPEWKSEWPAWEGGAQVMVDASHIVTRANMEIERIAKHAVPGGSIGAAMFLNLSRPVSAKRYDPHFPLDAALALAARVDSPECVIDTDKPSWGGTVIGAALGAYDTAQLCHNHFQRGETSRGGWGMIGPLVPGERDLTEKDELLFRTDTQYYHWLNCGIRLAATGGSAMGVMDSPLGYSRTYARVDGALTPSSYWAAVKAGRTFATTGPMLTLEVDGHGMGETLAVDGADARELEVQVRLESIQPVQSIEIIENGVVVGIFRPEAINPGQPSDQAFRWTVRPRRSGWYAARALFAASDGWLRQAHTSPVYVAVDGKPTAFADSASYMIRWVDRLTEIAHLPDRHRSDADREEVLALYRKARAFYEDVAAKAREHWGDGSGL